MMLLPMVSPYDDDPVKKDVIDTWHDQSLRYSVTDFFREGDQARKVKAINAHYQQLRHIPTSWVELPLQLF